MKPSIRQLFLSAAIALFFTVTLATLAEETAPPPAPEKVDAPPAHPQASPAPAATPAPAPAATPAAVAEASPDENLAEAPKEEAKPAAPPAAPATPAATESTEKPALRRLDVPSGSSDEKPARRRRSHTHRNGNELVSVGHNSVLAKDQKADAVVSVFGNSTSDGEVSDSVVSVFGNSKATGKVGNTVLSVFGNTYVNGQVSDAVVAVFGSVELGPDADVRDVVAVGGQLKRDPKAVVRGEVHNVSFGTMFEDMEWLHSWFVNCALRFRLLAFHANLMWAWWIALGFLALYIVIALLFGRGVEKCIDTLEQRPGFSILSALLTVLLAPVVTIILVMTGVGIAVVPFLAAGLFFAGIFGKAVMLAWLGRRLTSPLGVRHVAIAVLVGGIVIMLLYVVPILSLILYKLLGWVGLGVVVYTLALNMKREKPPAPPVVTPTPVAPMVDPVTGAPLTPSLVPATVVATTLPRAGFWIRTAAILIDVVLVGIVIAICQLSGKMEVIGLAAYGAIMWKVRGSTVGGIICNLKVVRLDGREIDWSTAIVRALGCFLSLVVVGLGFIWVAFDDEKQSWHDKIAGTTVVRTPKGVSLV